MEAEESVSLQHGEGNLSLSLCCWQVHLPFAVVGSTEEVKIGNKMAKARQYPWGVVQGTCTSRGRGSSRVTPRVAVPAGFGQVLDVGRWKGAAGFYTWQSWRPERSREAGKQWREVAAEP